MDDLILISYLNDFIFCPVSIYFHNLYGSTDNMLFQCEDQINGKNAHAAVDSGKYSSKKTVLQNVSVYCEKYGLVGKIDIFDKEKGLLTERKKKLKAIYDGQIFQLYAQYFSLTEMGYEVRRMRFISLDDNKSYTVALPADNPEMLAKFEKIVEDIRSFKPESFVQTNPAKCERCIYEPACDRACQR